MTQATSGDSPPRNTLAGWAYGLGIASLVLSLVVVGVLVGLVAVVLGIIALTRPGRKNMAVTGIVAGGLSVAFVMLYFWLFFLQVHPRLEEARHQGTISEILYVKTALGAFKTDVGRYPTTAEGLQALVTHPAGIGTAWREPYIDLERHLSDKWGHPLVYRCPGTADPTSYDLLSVGPDGVEGTKDDIGKNDEI
jgi:type II secretion system protein G